MNNPLRLINRKLSGRQMRLLVCRDCRTIEPLPDFDGPAEYDVLLEQLSSAHRYPNGEAHFGNLVRVAEEEWNEPASRQKLISAIQAKTTGIEGEFYATKLTFEDDAMKCFNAHHRPTEGCIDWRDSKKRLGNPTPAVRKNWRHNPLAVYLCNFCPVASWVATQERLERGEYK